MVVPVDRQANISNDKVPSENSTQKNPTNKIQRNKQH